MDMKGPITRVKWDLRVTRPGFLQSKQLIHEATIIPVALTHKITVKYDNILWVKELCLYDELATQSFFDQFRKAFREEPLWTSKVFNEFKRIESDVQPIIDRLLNTNWKEKSKNDRVKMFFAYVHALQSFQKYYTIAVPLTNFCEAELKNKVDVDFLTKIAIPIEPLDVSKMNDELVEMKRKMDRGSRPTEKELKRYLKQYQWIKTNYNIVQAYTKEEVLQELAQLNLKKEEVAPPIQPKLVPLVTGLQFGIYFRNRMKELSQRGWFAVESLGKEMAYDLNISRDEFFSLRYYEVLKSYEKGTLVVSKSELQQRLKGFVSGYLNRNEVFLTGKDADELFNDFNGTQTDQVSQIKGTCACPGNVRGVVRIISNSKDFNAFKEGEILVTPMTTPDFVILMKKASAIVTNEGGLSCHAAIVSRELNIPCVIGTKIATNALKTGDRIEVDATRGIVRKI